MPYCIVKDNKIVAGPQERPSRYNGVPNFNFLPEDQLAQYYWYPAILVNSQYDERYQRRLGPTFDFDGTQVTCTYTVVDLPIDGVRAKKLQDLAAKRWQVETAGMPFGESTIQTDRESQAQISGAYAAAKNGVLTELNFKSADGWITLTAQEMVYIGEAVYQHVQTHFNKEKVHYNNIQSLVTAKDIVDYDIEQGW